MYSLARSLLFKLDAEKAHHFTLDALNKVYKLGLLPISDNRTKPVKLMGINLPNPVGLAAGLDKNGEYIDALGALGFGFLEIGTVTPKPQPGNRSRASSAFPNTKASSTAWASTTTVLTP